VLLIGQEKSIEIEFSKKKNNVRIIILAIILLKNLHQNMKQKLLM
jgi:hypothetical protein